MTIKLNLWIKWSVALTALCLTSAAFGHVRWFAPEGLAPVELPKDGVTFVLVALVFGVVMAALGARVLANRVAWLHVLLVAEPSFPYRWLWYLLLCLINLFLISNLLYGDFIAPNLILPLDAVVWGVVAQAMMVIIMPWSVSVVGILLVLVAVTLPVLFPFPVALDYVFEFVSIGFALVLVGPSLSRFDRKMSMRFRFDPDAIREWSVIVLRIGLGAQLFELAVQNKLIRPEAALWFIEENPVYNFFPAIGLEQVTDLHFVFFVGISEVVLGLMLILNLARRTVLAMLLIAFATTAALSGGHELTGHLPIVGVVLVLLAEMPREDKMFILLQAFLKSKISLKGLTRSKQGA